ncbi:MAG: RNA-binding domain-containing protein [Pseudomonadota bacterium]
MKYKESDKQEFKLNFGNEVIETLVAFANAKGGSVVIGVNDKGKVEGVKIGKETVQNWINEIKNKTNPSIIPDVDVKKRGGKLIAVINTIEYPIKPVAFRGRYYKRVKNSNHLLNINEVVNMHLKTFNSSWDYYEDSNHTINDISLDKVVLFIERANRNREYPITDDPITFLKKYELLRDKKISKACFLLFMKEWSILSTIELGRFQTETLIKDGTTVRTDVLSEVDEVMHFITKHINKAYVITGKPQRDEVWDYPLDALRELVINMVVHRDYSSSS